jgi:hypothetical protein
MYSTRWVAVTILRLRYGAITIPTAGTAELDEAGCAAWTSPTSKRSTGYESATHQYPEQGRIERHGEVIPDHRVEAPDGSYYRSESRALMLVSTSSLSTKLAK